MKVYILFKDKYEGREVEGVYPSLEAAQKRYPDITWEQDERYDYEDGPPCWGDSMRGLRHRDCHIEEHELEYAKGGVVSSETAEEIMRRIEESK